MTAAPSTSARWPSIQPAATVAAPIVGLLRRVPALLLLVAATLGAVAVAAPGTVRAGWWAWVPEDPAGTDALATALSTVAIAAIAMGLLRGRRDALLVAVTSLTLALLVPAWSPLAPARSIAAAGCIGILLLDRRRYVVRSRPGSRRFLLGLAGIAAALTTASVLAAAAAGAEPAGIAVEATLALRSVIAALSFSGTLPISVAHVGLGVLVLLGLARVALALGAVALLRPDTVVPRPLSARARRIVVEHGHGSLLPFQLGDGVGGFEVPGMEAVVVFAVEGRHAIALGEPVGRAEDRASTWGGFVDWCASRDLVPAMYQATAAGRVLDARTSRSLRVGLEAVVDLPVFSLASARRANLRHTVTRAHRGGIRIAWWPDGVPDAEAAIRAGLSDVDAAWRRARPGPSLGFTVGAFDPQGLGSMATSVALDATGQPVAFATFLPTGRDVWVLGLMRRTPGSVPGAFESCVVEAAQRLAATGAAELSLGLVPLSGLDPRSGPLPERLLALASRVARPAYDVRGLESFKRKFDPRWEPRYLVLRRSADVLGAGLALVRLHLGPAGVTGALASVARRPRPDPAQRARRGPSGA